MSDRISYSCVALRGSGKVGKLTPDTDGYYELLLGGLECYNSSGAFYPMKDAKRLFESSSSLMRRIADGSCRGELGHPKRESGQDMRSFLSRVSTIYEDQVCCHFRDVHLDNAIIKDPSGKEVVAVVGYVKPSGPKGVSLGESLDNPKENVCFSVRSLTDDRMERGQLVKHIRSIITWDYVNEPGISFAKKWMTPSLESFDDLSFTREHVEGMSAGTGGVSMESAAVSKETIFVDFGWKRTSPSGLVLPASAKW